ncbi:MULTISPECIES: AtpZ/AtpI family protein [Alkalihalobacterium]|uniref:AtpZ/AtpI family protein n=1 Tax=Alkalihalobacterium chitinilyticum TaxID=2980103 RepID=A0ABT5VGV8_9BACI|nr:MULTISPECIES: AtpZ/AtpI family protein [Alkalihalobacterium]MDE5414694.1 AtpZ/AtpI family protein [Alkalihalobacterium chitinilyticum]MEB1807187.1 AtpZ/AtpI family protein [Bacillaceae bacterium]
MADKKPQKPYRAMALMTAITSYLVGPVLVGVLAGRWLDGYFDKSPLFMIIGLFLGLGSGIYGLIRLLGSYLGEDDS